MNTSPKMEPIEKLSQEQMLVANLMMYRDKTYRDLGSDGKEGYDQGVWDFFTARREGVRERLLTPHCRSKLASYSQADAEAYATALVKCLSWSDLWKSANMDTVILGYYDFAKRFDFVISQAILAAGMENFSTERVGK